MCGIVGYIGKRQAQGVLIDCLAKLEYRGYDSCGIALGGSELQIYKDAARVYTLGQAVPRLNANIGLGHTRWATHGPPNKVNAHPHSDCKSKIAVVHNGVINNYLKLRFQLAKEGHKFVSETDTEVIPHLIEKYYEGDLKLAVFKAVAEIEGSYAIIAMIEGRNELVFARKDSPLIVGIGDGEFFIASDVPAVLEYTNRVIYLEEGDLGIVSPEGIHISQNGLDVVREEQRISWSPEQAQKSGYEYYMLKEIHEQPRVARDTISEYLSIPRLPFSIAETGRLEKSLLLLACGSSYNAAQVGKYICERLINIPVRTEMASEFNYYYNMQYSPIVIGLSQSGETADTLKAMRRSKDADSKVVAITNVVGSTASKVANHTLYTRAGPEISVAATKTFTAQLIALYWLALAESKIDSREKSELIREFRQLPNKIQQVFESDETVSRQAETLSQFENIFYVGRGINFPIAQEGALKLKEISYIHSEAYAAGEIKHGPFALLSPITPVVAIVSRDKSYDAMLTSIKEIKARGSRVCAIADENDDLIKDLVDCVIKVPSTSAIFSPFINTVVVQLIAYYAAKKRKCPIDYPRNLAKSVTVE